MKEKQKNFEIPLGHIQASMPPFTPFGDSKPLGKTYGPKMPEKPKTPEQMAMDSCKDNCRAMHKKPKL